MSGGIRGTAGSIDTLGPSTGMDLLGRSTGAEIGVPGKEAMLRLVVGFSWSFAKTRLKLNLGMFWVGKRWKFWYGGYVN